MRPDAMLYKYRGQQIHDFLADISAMNKVGRTMLNQQIQCPPRLWKMVVRVG